MHRPFKTKTNSVIKKKKQTHFLWLEISDLSDPEWSRSYKNPVNTFADDSTNLRWKDLNTAELLRHELRQEYWGVMERKYTRNAVPSL